MSSVTPDPSVVELEPLFSHRVPTIRLRVLDTEVATARHTLTQMLGGLVPNDHLGDLVSCTSELVTNAIHAATAYAMLGGWAWTHYDEPIHVGVVCTARWTRLDVRDPDPAMPMPEPRGLLDVDGKGLLIVNALAARLWWSPEGPGKAVHAVIAMPLVELTDAELAEAAR